MATVSIVSNKKVLIVEDMHEVRKNLQMSLSTLGFNKLHTASNIRTALELMVGTSYDIILCDYNLGEGGADGQQFLEYLRKKDRLAKGALFIMLTAESSYKSVVTAAEYLPDDYMLKPFTAAAFMQRLERLSQYQSALFKTTDAYQYKKWDLVIKEADEVIALKDKNYFEAVKLKASALFNADRAKEALDLYEGVILIRELPWAQLGLAKCKAKLGDFEESREMCVKIMNESPHHLSTVDFYSELMMATDKPVEAQEALRRAALVSPNNLQRARMLGSLAMANGNNAEAELMMTSALRHQKHSLVKSALDYALVAKAMSAQDKTENALEYLDIAKKEFTDSYSVALLAATSSMAHAKAGDMVKAAEEMVIALSVDTANIQPEYASSLAEVFMKTGNEDKATSMMRRLIQNNPENLTVKSQLKIAYAASGKKTDHANDLIEESLIEIKKANEVAIDALKNQRHADAVAKILESNLKSPNNLDLMTHGALIIAMAIASHAVDKKLIQDCRRFRSHVAELNPAHSKLPAIDNAIKKAELALYE